MDPSETWLKEECNGLAFFPNENGHFSLQKITPYTTLLVEGPIASGLNMRVGFQTAMAHTIAGRSINSTLQREQTFSATSAQHVGPPTV